MAADAIELDTASSVLASAREQRAIADQAEANLLEAAVQWAAMHSTDSIDEAEMLVGYGDQGMPLAGAGAPLVAEFAVTEFAAAIGLSTDAGKSYVGDALELRHRLPRVWRRVVRGDLKAWQARRIAERTLLLSREAASFVDAHVAPTAHKIGPYQLHALVEQAIAHFMPDLAEERRLAKADGRYFTIEAQQDSCDGTAAVHGQLDVADAHDLETAVAAVAAQLKDLGSDDSLDVRRALAVGEMARAQMTFDLNPTSVEPVETHRGTQRQVVLYVHLNDSALHGAAGTARLERGNSQVTAGQVRDWCGTSGSVVVKPVIDLDTHDPVDSAVVPDRHAELVALRDKTCVFPWCNRPARRCDKDHSIPHNKGGPTCPCNLAPLCRRHHRIKTHGAWTYRTIEPGTYLWTSKHGYQYLRDTGGTLDVSRDRPRPPD